MATSEAKLKIVVDAQDRTKAAFQSVNTQLGQTSSTMRSLATTAKYVGTAAAGAVGALGGYGLKIAADLQTARVGLMTLLGSAEKADKTVQRLKVEAARTPFELPGLTQATQLLSSVTKDGDKSIDIILNIGEALAAMGKGQAELDRIIVNLQQVGAIGYASMVDIKQFAYAGIPIFEMLQKETKLSGEALEVFIGEGNVKFDMLVGMFDRANDAGGQFFGAYKNNMGTFNQSFSNLKDSLGIFASDIVQQTGLFDALIRAMQGASGALANYQTILGTAREAGAKLMQAIDEKTGLITLMRDAWANLVFIYQNSLGPALAELWQTFQPYKPFLDALVQVFGTMLVIAIGGAVMILGTLAIALTGLLTLLVKLTNFFHGFFLGVWDAINEKIAKVITTVEKLIGAFKNAFSWGGKVLNKAGSFISGKDKSFSVDDAVISPQGKVITTHPDDYLIATKNPASLAGGGLVININGGTYLSEDAAVELGDLLMRRLKLSNQF